MPARTRPTPVTTIEKTARGTRDGGNDGGDYTHIFKWGPHRLRVKIHIDQSYDFQSRAHIERWNGEKWFEVASMPGKEAAALTPVIGYWRSATHYKGQPRPGYWRNPEDPASYREVEARLFTIAQGVLG